MNLCFDALDLRVIRGQAAEPAVRDESGTTDVARLLEETAALAGAMRGLGVVPGSRVPVDLRRKRTRLVACLAALRLGAVPVLDFPVGLSKPPFLLGTSALFVSDWAPSSGSDVPAVILDGAEPLDEVRDLPMDLAVRAGRTDPAPVADPLPDTPAYVVGQREVREPETETFLGAALAALRAGEVVDLR